MRHQPTINVSSTANRPSDAITSYYGVCVDAVAGESDTTNNCSNGLEIPTTDLVVDEPSMMDNAFGNLFSEAARTVAPTSTFTLAATVRNDGDAASAPTTLRYYRSTDAMITTSDTAEGTDAVEELGPSGSTSESVQLTAPATAGTYYYGACVDALADESDTTNNCSTSVQVTVTEPPPPPPQTSNADLVVLGPNVSETSVETSETFAFIATVTNDGDAQSQSAATTVRYLRSTDATITESDTEEGTDEVRALLLNQGYAATIRLTAPSTAGTYYYGACVDAVAGESDTTNNCSESVTVEVEEPPATTSPIETQGCPADAETWRGLQVCDEQPRDGYDRNAFGTGYSSFEDEIIAALPLTMKANGQVYTPYSCLAFDITPDGTAATDIEHIVALAETHDSGIADDRRRDIASDLDNLTIADPTVNRSQKSDRDAAEWMPARHGAWFAERVIQVKLEYGLSVDSAERDALEALLAGGGAQLNCVDAVAPTPTMLTLSAASAPAEGGNPVTVTATLDNPAPANGMTVTLTTGGTATLDTDYTLSSTTITLADGETAGTVTITVTDDAEDDDGETIVIDAESTNPALTAEQLTLTIEDNDVTPVPALPLGGAMLLGLLLTLLGAVRMRMRDRTDIAHRY